ncbi:MAG: hypothetical protein AB1758_11900 [Candidatus Eremiobacterota bacterium]
MLKKLFGKKGRPGPLVADPETRFEVHLDPGSDSPRLLLAGEVLEVEPRCHGTYALEPFLEERKRTGQPLTGYWDNRRGTFLVAIERERPLRRYELCINPGRRRVSYTELLRGPLDTRAPRLAPRWCRRLPAPAWPLRSGRATVSAAFTPEGVLFLLGNRVRLLDAETGKTLGDWPVPGRDDSQVVLDLIGQVGDWFLGSYRVLLQGTPSARGMLLLRLEEDRPLVKLFPGSGSVSVNEPVAGNQQRLVVETRVYSGEDYIPSRAQWVLDLEKQQFHTAVLGGPPDDQGMDWCLSLRDGAPNALTFEPVEGLHTGHHPERKLTAHPAFESGQAQTQAVEVVRRGALWPGRALGYEASRGELRLYAWVDESLQWAHCGSCGAPLPTLFYRCLCGQPVSPK